MTMMLVMLGGPDMKPVHLGVDLVYLAAHMTQK